ncbi:hypothetical protein NQZ68_035713 [Dissostichus eleginoides]|nr:hypothetical protein NQZ68_035713 [Dissostichus eleginoides]
MWMRTSASGAGVLMENGSMGGSKTGARPLVAASFPYIRDGDGGVRGVVQETLKLVSSTAQGNLNFSRFLEYMRQSKSS